MLYQLIKPILFRCDAERAHDVVLNNLKRLHTLGLSFLYRKKFTKDPVKVMGLHFPHRVGLAAGLDKNGDYIDALAAMGFAFIEIGTVTPKPQEGNPKPRLFRLTKSKAIINRMGFNNKGVDYLLEQVKKRKSKVILGINIGKNATTAMENAVDDYVYCLRKVYAYADYITANISSPNTKNLRDLQSGDALITLIATLKQEQQLLTQKYQRYVPIAIKVAPDLTDEQISYLAQVFKQHKVDAVIATNTTITREGCHGEAELKEQGGLSGVPLLAKANHVLAEFKKQLASDIAIIGVGGIQCLEDVALKLSLGAELTQVYSGLVYGIKSFVNKP